MISGPDAAYFESLGIKDSAVGGNPYPAGSAYISGAGGAGDYTLINAPGDRVFIIHLTGTVPEGGDLTGNGKVDLEDIAMLGEGWQSIFDITTLSNIVLNWLFIEPPVFNDDPITEANAQVNAAYSGTLADNVTYYDAGMLTFTKINGPEWLNVTANGLLSGIPATGDIGDNSFTVQIDDGINTPVQAALEIKVYDDPANFELLKAVPFTEVSFNDEFWLPRLETNRQVTVPYIFDRLEGVYNAAKQSD